MIFELSLHVWVLFMLEKLDNFVFFIGSKMLIVFSLLNSSFQECVKGCLSLFLRRKNIGLDIFIC